MPVTKKATKETTFSVRLDDVTEESIRRIEKSSGLPRAALARAFIVHCLKRIDPAYRLKIEDPDAAGAKDVMNFLVADRPDTTP